MLVIFAFPHAPPVYSALQASYVADFENWGTSHAHRKASQSRSYLLRAGLLWRRTLAISLFIHDFLALHLVLFRPNTVRPCAFNLRLLVLPPLPTLLRPPRAATLHCPPNLEAPPFALRSMLMSFLLIAAGAEVPVPRLPAGRCGKADFGRRQCGGTLHVLRLTAASLIARFEPDIPGPSRQRGGTGVRRYRTRTPTSGTIQWGIASERARWDASSHSCAVFTALVVGRREVVQPSLGHSSSLLRLRTTDSRPAWNEAVLTHRSLFD